MAIIGVFTDVGIAKCIDARNNEGFDIFPLSFGVSDLKTVPSSVLPPLTVANAGQWFVNTIASRVVVNDHTIKIVCTIPPGSIPPATTKFVREIYVYAKDSALVTFLLAVGQTSADIVYEPTGSVTLELELSLTNTDLSSKFVFEFTQAQEIIDHNTDPNAHPDHTNAINNAGIFLKAGGLPFAYRGQSFDEKANFQGVQASVTHGGITFTADYTGTEWNGKVITFNGTDTVNAVVFAFNNANPTTQISHNGTGLEILAAGTPTLVGGTILVADKDIVYRDTDGFYKKALADGSIKSRVAGLAEIGLGRRFVRSQGFLAKTTGYATGTELFLSTSVAGTFSNIPSPIKVGIQTHTGTILIGTGGGGSSSGSAQGYDAVVTDSPGFGFFPTTQQAIASVGDGTFILVDKLEQVAATIDTQNKELTFVFNGPLTGWNRFIGAAEQQKISFSAVPTSGTWRIKWNGNSTTDLAYNANAAAVEAAFLLLPGVPVGTTITGNYASGFTINYTTFNDYPEPTFLDAGVNEIQRFDLSPFPPDDGTIRFTYEGDDTVNVAYNDDLTQLELAFEALPDIQDVTITGGFAAGYIQIEFINQDGLQPKNNITVAANTLEKLAVPVGTVFTTPQQGAYPQSNLKIGITPITITPTTLQGGSPVGPGTAILVTKDRTRFLGNGRVENFDNGINLQGHVDVDIELNFMSTDVPIINTGLDPGRDYHHLKSFGLLKQVTRTVGNYGDYMTLAAAYAAADEGDKILVMENQSILVAQVWNKNVEIEFAPEVYATVDAIFAGPIITFGNRIRTRNIKVKVLNAGSYDTVFLFQNDKSHHANLELETNGVGVFIDAAYELAVGSNAVFVDGVITKGSATVTDVILNSSTFVSHNIVIRSKDDGTVIDLLNREPPIQETPTGVVDGVNTAFTLSQPPASPQSVLVMVDSLPRFEGIHFNVTGQVIVFTAGNIPQTGQDVYAYYWKTALMATPASGRAAPLEVRDNLVPVLAPVAKINFGSGIDAVAGPGPDQVTVTVPPGGGLGTWTVEYHTLTGPEITAKKFTMAFTPVVGAEVLADMIANGPQIYATDFTVSTNEFDWNGLGLDGVLLAGDKMRLAYFR